MSNFAGFRIQIDNHVFPEGMISRGSFKMTPTIRRKASEFYDANGKKHETYYPHSGVEISFTIRKRTFEEQKGVAAFFEGKEIFDIVYWDDSAMDYKTGDFRVNDIIYQHEKKKNGLPQYAETEIKFERI